MAENKKTEDSSPQLKVLKGGPDYKRDASNTATDILASLGIDERLDSYQRTHEDLINIILSNLRVLDQPTDIKARFPFLKAGEKILFDNQWDTVRRNKDSRVITEGDRVLYYGTDETLAEILTNVKAIAVNPPYGKADRIVLDKAA